MMMMINGNEYPDFRFEIAEQKAARRLKTCCFLKLSLIVCSYLLKLSLKKCRTIQYFPHNITASALSDC